MRMPSETTAPVASPTDDRTTDRSRFRRQVGRWCNSSGPGARSALTRMAARPREREPGALAARRGSGRQQAHRRLPQSPGKGGQPAWPITTPDRRGVEMRTFWRRTGAWLRAGRDPLSCSRELWMAARPRDCLCPKTTALAPAVSADPASALMREQDCHNCRWDVRMPAGSGGERPEMRAVRMSKTGIWPFMPAPPIQRLPRLE